MIQQVAEAVANNCFLLDSTGPNTPEASSILVNLFSVAWDRLVVLGPGRVFVSVLRGRTGSPQLPGVQAVAFTQVADVGNSAG